MPTRAQFIAKGREFLRTPYRHEGRLKNIGIDCIGIPLCMCEELGISDKHGVPIRGGDYRGYPQQPTNNFVHEELQRRAIEKPVSQMQPGDVLTICFPSIPCHVAIVTELRGHPAILHAYSLLADSQRRGLPGWVVEHVLDAKWRRRVAGVFTMPGVEN